MPYYAIFYLWFQPATVFKSCYPVNFIQMLLVNKILWETFYWKTISQHIQGLIGTWIFICLLWVLKPCSIRGLRVVAVCFYNFQLYVHWCIIQALLLSAVYACYYTNDYGKHFFIIPFLLPYFWNCFFTSAAKSLDYYSQLKPINEKICWNTSFSFCKNDSIVAHKVL